MTHASPKASPNGGAWHRPDPRHPRYESENVVYVRGVVESNPVHTRAHYGTRDIRFLIGVRDYRHLRGRDPKVMYFWVRCSGMCAHEIHEWISKGSVIEVWGWLETRYFLKGGEKVLLTEVCAEKLVRIGEGT
jgi:primosomal replication protein N